VTDEEARVRSTHPAPPRVLAAHRGRVYDGRMSDDVKHPSDLGIDVSEGRPQQLYRWLLASVLFGRPVQQSVAADTYRVLIDHGLTSPARFAEHDHEGLRRLLDEGSYARIDHVMSDELHEVMAHVVDDWGSVSHLVRSSADRGELTARLTALTGVGPKTAEIFTRELPGSLYGTAEA
jgi:endonuclease III